VTPVIVAMLRSVTHHTAASPSPSNVIGPVRPGHEERSVTHQVRRANEDQDERLVLAGFIGDDAAVDRPVARSLEWSNLESRASQCGQDPPEARGVPRGIPGPTELYQPERRGDDRDGERSGKRDAPALGAEPARPSVSLHLRPLLRQHVHHTAVKLGGGGALQRRGEHAQSLVDRDQFAAARSAAAKVPPELELIPSLERAQDEIGELGAHVVTRHRARLLLPSARPDVRSPSRHRYDLPVP
jgi:hypothetical protein